MCFFLLFFSQPSHAFSPPINLSKNAEIAKFDGSFAEILENQQLFKHNTGDGLNLGLGNEVWWVKFDIIQTNSHQGNTEI
ncbi:MAG: hypothetical protein EOP04_06110 [Proteobacteria bacterium]|nr:MAG: hypothetical protein EOP04_06110 [Pseudomonadota bacterium]